MQLCSLQSELHLQIGIFKYACKRKRKNCDDKSSSKEENLRGDVISYVSQLKVVVAFGIKIHKEFFFLKELCGLKNLKET